MSSQPYAAQIDWADIETESATLLSRYLQFDTTNPPGDEAHAIEYLADLLAQRDIAPTILKSTPTRANLVARLPAQAEATAPPILLYAHADVVPADATAWSVDPFGGVIEDEYVWGRGALDDKGLGIIFLQAMTLLKRLAVPLCRDVILLIAADEELQSKHGVAWMLATHPDLIQAEYVWDEGGMGLRLPDRECFYGIAVSEKTPMRVRLTAQGRPGHAAVPNIDSAQDRLVRGLMRLQRWQQPIKLTPTIMAMLRTIAQRQSFPRSWLFRNPDHPFAWPILRFFLQRDPTFTPLLRNTLNLTWLQSGEANNVVPATATAEFDVRLLPNESQAQFLHAMRSMLDDPRITVEAIEQPPMPHAPTPTDSDFYRALADTIRELGPKGLISPYMTPGATDSRFFRRAGMKAYGFMPMLLDGYELSRIHGIDERVSTANLRWGTRLVFETLVRLG